MNNVENTYNSYTMLLSFLQGMSVTAIILALIVEQTFLNELYKMIPGEFGNDRAFILDFHTLFVGISAFGGFAVFLAATILRILHRRKHARQNKPV